MPETKARTRAHRTRVLQWVPTDADQLAEAEARILAPIAGLFEQSTVAGLNTITHRHTDASHTLVLLHGFAGGIGNWMPVWADLAKRYTVHAVDLPGFARSARTPGIHFETDVAALGFMVSGLAAWFSAMAFTEPVVLVGHSFGGYVASHFSIAHPSKVSNLVLADPWGVDEPRDRQLPLRWKCVVWIISRISPLAILRAAGPCGPAIMPRTRKDFADRWRPYFDDPYVFYDYTYHCNAGHPTGERAFRGCATHQGFATLPLIRSLPGQLSTKIGLTVLYGDQTWMRKETGAEMVVAFRQAGGVGTYGLIPNAGHQVVSDNAPAFAAAVVAALSGLESSTSEPFTEPPTDAEAAEPHCSLFAAIEPNNEESVMA